jgi:DNA-binding NarL/FixJ family response regulator
VIRVVIVDDQELVRAGLRALAVHDGDIEVVAEARTGHEGLARVRDLRPDVVLMDLRMPELDGDEATARILAAEPGTRVIILTTYESDDAILRAIGAGASGYLLKAAPEAELLAGIRAVAAGEVALAPSVSRVLVRQATQPAPAVLLTPRELDVLRLVAEGLSNREIGEQLHLGEATVKTHLLTAFPKLDARTRTGAVTRARELGLLGG